MKSLYSLASRVQTASNVKLSESLATKRTENLLKKFILRSAAVFALFLFLGGSVWGQTAGFNSTFAILSINGAANAYYDLNAGTSNTDFNGANLGTFNPGSSNSLTLKGAEHNVYKCGSCDLTSTRLRYRIYSTSVAGGEFLSINVPFTSTGANGCGGSDQQWSLTGHNLNVLSGLSPGTYYVEVYSEATVTCSGGTVYASNNSTNYRATFTVSGTNYVTTNNSSGLASSYATLAAAITALNAATITSPVVITFNGSETAPTGGYNITKSGTSANTITIQGTSAASSVITAAVGSTSGALNDAIFKITGADWITIQNFTMQERTLTPVSADITAGTNTMTEFGVALFYATTTDGAQNCTIQNNTIMLNRTYQNTFGIYSNSTHSATSVTGSATASSPAGSNSGLKVYGNSISNINHGILIIGATAAADFNTGIDIGGTASGTGNTISNFGTTGFFSGFLNVSGTVNGIQLRNSTGFNVSYNSITSSNGGITTSATLRGIFIPAASISPSGTFTNTINNNTIALTHGFTSGTIRGIDVEATTGTATSTQNINNNNFTTLRSSALATSGAITAISNVMPNLVNNFNGNTFTNISTNTTGSFTFFGHSYTMPATGSQTLDGNSIVTGFSKTGAGGTVTISTSATSSPNGTFHTFTNNNFSNITVTGATGIVGVGNADGSVGSATRTVTGNTFNNWTGGTSAIIGLSYGYIGGTTSTVSNNTLTNITGQSTISGIVIGSPAGLATTLNVANNTINNLSSTGTGGQVVGISCANTSTTININSNAINTLSSTGASSVVGAITVFGATTTNVFQNVIYGISTSGATAPIALGIQVAGGTLVNVYGNKIYNLSASGSALTSSASAVSGIYLNGGITVNTHKNVIGNLTAPSANLADAIRGINILSTTATSTQRVYYNTIYLNATSSGANFGSAAIYHTMSATATTASLDLRNNIVINNSTAAGTGLAVAFRRSSSTLTNYASTSNNNMFYGTSGVMNDGTTTYASGAYLTLVSTRDNVSKFQNPTFASTTGSDATFLNFANGAINLAGGNAQVISGYTTDYSGATRSGTAPDIGAYEFAEATAPAPSITTISPTILCVQGGQTVTITGTNLDVVTAVSFNGTAGTISSQSATSLTAVVPTNITDGNIVITSTGGTASSAYTTQATPATPTIAGGGTACSSATLVVSNGSEGTMYWQNNTSNGTSTATPSSSQSVTASGTYYFRAQSTAGCWSVQGSSVVTISTPISITTQPSATVQNKCVGIAATALTVAVTGTSPTYQWYLNSANSNTGGTLISLATTASYTPPTAAGNVGTTYYYCIVSSAAPCNSSVTSSVSGAINVFALPSVSISSSSNIFCSTAVQLTASGASTYAWSPSTTLSAATGATVNASPTATTTYTVTGTDANTCVGTATKTITKGNPVTMGSLTAAQPSACAGGTVQLNGNATLSSAVTSYSFAASASSYAAVTGTDLTGTANLGDDVGSGNLPIGFTFPYNGSTHTVFAMSSNGLLILGNTTAALTGFPGNALASTSNVIAALWDDNNTVGGTMTYVTSGSAPNRVLTAQWTNMHVAGSGSPTTPTISVQVQLFESGVVKINYGATSAALSSPTATVGISGASGSYLSVTSGSPITSSSVSSSTENASINAVNLVSGTVFTFTPPSLTYAWTFTNNSNSLSSSTIVNPIATVNAADTYTLTATGSDGCSATGSASIALGGGSPTVTASATSTTFCVGGSTTLSSSITGGCSPFTYSWSDGSSVVSTSASFSASPTSTKTYTLTVTDNNSSTGTSSVTITVNSLPTVAVNSGTFCSAGSPLTLTATGASTYAWSPATGLSASSGATVNAAPTSTSTYTVTGTDGNGCISTATSTVTYTQSPSAITISQTPASVCSGSVGTITMSGGAVSSSGNATFGAGTSANGTSTFPNPLLAWYGGAKHQMLISASELIAQGLTAGSNISSVKFDINAFGATACTNFTIRMGHTSNTALTTFVSGTTTVYGPSTYTPSSTGSVTFTFTTPFTWNGTSNLVLETVHNAGNSGNGTTTTVKYTTTATNTVYYGASDNVTGGIAGFDALTSWTNAGASASRPNMIFGHSYLVPTIISWSPTTNLYTNAGATTAYTGVSATTVYAVNTSSTQYTATATNGSCSTSQTITTAINPLPTATISAMNSPICSGSAATFTLTGTSGAVVTYNLNGGLSATVTLTGGTASVSVSNASSNQTLNLVSINNTSTNCSQSISGASTVVVNTAVSITAQPNNSVSLEGADATFSVTASGTGLTYQWHVSTDSGSSWNNASGTSTNSSYTEYSITASMAGYHYRCIVSGTAPCGSVTSSVATLTISTTAITSQPASATICSNGSNTFSISTSGSTPTYQWQVSTDAGVSYTDISGETTSSLTVSGLTATNSGNRYRCVLSSSIYSDPAVLTVYDAVVIGTQPTSQIVCSNAASASFSVSATGSNLTYQWQVSTNGGSSWSNASGTSTAATYTISTVTNALNLNQYRVVVSGSSPCAAVTSNAATLNVIGVSLAASSASICMNGSFTLTATPTSGSPTLSYSWICATSGSGATTANTSNPATITPTAVGSYTYTLTTTGGGCTLTSTTAVTVDSNPSITSATASPSSVCAGSNVSLSATSISGASGTATLGTGTSTATSIYGTFLRVGNTIGNQFRTQYLFLSSELQSAGLLAGNISGLTFDVSGSGGGSVSNLTFKMGVTSLTGLTTTYITGLTQVYFASTYPATGSLSTGLQSVTFNTPFYWDGSSNIVLEACSQLSVVGTDGTLRSTVTSFVSTIQNNASTSGCSTATGGGTYSERPNFKFGGQVSTNNAANFNWSWNTTPVVTTAAGTTTASNNTSSPTSQTYTVTATNPTTGCTSTSTTAAITINPTPSTPTANSTSICGTQNATCSVTGSGVVGNTFKWYTVATGGTPILGQSGSSLSAYSVSTTTTFYVSESNATCESTRVAVTQTVTTPPSVSASATSATICAGQSSTLSASSSNSGYSYSWSNSAGSGTSVSVSPVTTTTYTVSATDVSGGASNGCASTATVPVTVNPVPTSISAGTSIATICNGDLVNLNSSAISNSSSISTLINEGFESGIPSSWVALQNGSGNIWTAANTTSYGTIYQGSGMLQYLWSSSNAANTYAITTAVALQAGNTYTINFYEQTGAYNERLKLTVGLAQTVAAQTTVIADYPNHQVTTWTLRTNTFTPTVSGNYYFGLQAYSTSNKYFINIDNFTVTVPSYPNYSWASSPIGFNSSSQNPTAVAPTQTTTYTVTATNSFNCSSSASATVTVSPVSVAGTASSDQTICSGSTPTALTLSGNTGTIQWQSSTTSSTSGFTNISGGTNATLTLAALTATTYYRAVVTSGVCTSATSNVVTVTVNPTSVAGTVSANQAICSGSSPASITLSGSTGTVQWQSSTDNSTFADINGATNSTLTAVQMGTLTTTTYHKAIVTSGVCSSATSSTVTVTVNALPTATITPSGATTFCAGGNVVLTASAGTSYSWSNGATTQAITVTASGNYSVTVTNVNNCTAASGATPVVVNALPTATITPSGATTFCSGGNVDLTASAGSSYLWSNGSTAASITANSSGSYSVTVTDANGCSATSNATTITVNTLPSAPTASGLSNCGSISVSLYASASSGATTDWYANATGGSPLAQAIGQYTTPTLNSTTTYYVEGRDIATGCVSATRTAVTVTINTPAVPSVTIASSDADNSICPSEEVIFTATATNGGSAPTYQWKLNGSNVSGSGSTYTSTSLVNSDIVSVVMTANNSCQSPNSATSNAITTVVNSTPAALSITGSTYCSHTNALPNTTYGSVTSASSTSGVNYTLFNVDGDEVLLPIPGTNNALVWTGVVASLGYYVIGVNASTGCVGETSSPAQVSITSATIPLYTDTDGDNFGTGAASGWACSASAPAGYSLNTGDCDDSNSAIKPTAVEICGNNIDENCSGASDDIPSYYRTIADGNWGDISTWEVACSSGITYTTAAYAPPSYYTGTVNIRNTHDVTIPTGSTTWQTGTLDIDLGGSLTLTGNDYLNTPTSNSTTNNIPSIAKLSVTLLIDNAGALNIGHQASLVQTSTTASNTGSGNINVESKLTGTNNGTAPNGRYWYIGSPMNNTVGSQFFDAQNMVRLWSYNGSNNSWGTVIHSTSNPTVTTTNKLVPGIGYLYRAGANKTITYVGTAGANLNNNITTNLLNPTLDGTVVPVLGYQSTGYKFVSNPYISHIDWRLVTRSGLNVSYWIRNSNNSAYDAYNATTNVSTGLSGQTTQFIPPMQGFYVYAFNSTPSLRIDNTDRVHSSNVLHAPIVNQVVRLKLNNGESSDYAVVYENEVAANDYEEADTDKMFDYDFHQLYTLEGEHELALNGLLNATSKGSVDMGIAVPNNGSYTIEATDLEVEEEVILEDKFTNIFQDLKVNPIYSFTSNAGTFNERFVLHFTAIGTETVGVEETDNDAVKIFNTSNQQVKIWVSNSAEYQGATVKVYDAIGNLIERKNMTSNELLLNLDIASGIYVVEVTGDSKVFTKKIFISK